ncbi:hypothetical protein PPUN14671_00140 [Pseudomonas putida]|uniref:Pilus assembly protein PilW n=2 Tax=Pseudomonas putida TaxID=303 RepID=A0AA37VLW0_PSEPU|nr:hypothetical protein PPUN14671_00140 [Pseudomonas putida]
MALAIGLMLLAAASQLFASARQTWRLQSTAVRMQGEARFALLRMAQDIRMAGMFGCLHLAAQPAFDRPFEVGPSSLSLMVAELPGHAGDPDWTVVTNCLNEVKVHKGRAQGSETQMTVPVSRHDYVHSGTTLYFKRRGNNQPLVEHVRELRVTHVPGERVDLQLTLYEPILQLEQQHALSVAIRNSVPTS